MNRFFFLILFKSKQVERTFHLYSSEYDPWDVIFNSYTHIVLERRNQNIEISGYIIEEEEEEKRAAESPLTAFKYWKEKKVICFISLSSHNCALQEK